MTLDARRCSDPLRVAVTSDHTLVAESVVAALRGLGHLSYLLGRPRSPALRRRPPDPEAGRTASASDLGLMVVSLDTVSGIAAAREVVSRLDVSWVVLSDTPAGPGWGALLERGVATIMPSSTDLDALVRVLRSVSDAEAVFPRRRRSQLVAAWGRHEETARRAAAALRALTPREHEVLRLLHSGVGVRDIAVRFEVSDATVRSQVKAVLRKLGVRSQLAAVAAFQQAVSDQAPGPAPVATIDEEPAAGSPAQVPSTSTRLRWGSVPTSR